MSFFDVSGGLELTSRERTAQVGIKCHELHAQRLLFTHVSMYLAVKCGCLLTVNDCCCEAEALDGEVKGELQ